ncbi:Uncharacterised protein [Legionella cincinnatiensis]|uniref:Uncharacterized protein n=1 Tax=Legionella cincinnatiensis TaxID=28085 RepID=A0A378IHL8_9GAMM|nr:Uncharacterised protein [Legionella cincinnatiensis]
MDPLLTQRVTFFLLHLIDPAFAKGALSQYVTFRENGRFKNNQTYQKPQHTFKRPPAYAEGDVLPASFNNRPCFRKGGRSLNTSPSVKTEGLKITKLTRNLSIPSRDPLLTQRVTFFPLPLSRSCFRKGGSLNTSPSVKTEGLKITKLTRNLSIPSRDPLLTQRVTFFLLHLKTLLSQRGRSLNTSPSVKTEGLKITKLTRNLSIPSRDPLLTQRVTFFPLPLIVDPAFAKGTLSQYVTFRENGRSKNNQTYQKPQHTFKRPPAYAEGNVFPASFNSRFYFRKGGSLSIRHLP